MDDHRFQSDSGWPGGPVRPTGNVDALDAGASRPGAGGLGDNGDTPGGRSHVPGAEGQAPGPDGEAPVCGTEADASDGSDGRWTIPPDAVGRVLRELLTLSVIILLTFAARSAFGDHYWVPSGSMEKTLMPGDRVVVDKTAYGLRLPFTTIEIIEGDRVRPGDIVVFDSPESGDRLIKRAVAVGESRVTLRNGHLEVDGEPLADPSDPAVEIFDEHRAELNLDHGGGPDIRGITVPEGMVLVLGDHRGNSRDGRAFGLIPEDVIYGRALAIYWRTGDGLTWKGL